MRVYSSFEKLEALPGNGRNRILLAGEEIPYEQRKQITAGKRLFSPRVSVRTWAKRKKSCRDTRAQSLTAGIMEVLKDDRSGPGSRYYQKSDSGRVFSHSPNRKDNFAIRLGKALAEKQNVLYVNLETYAGEGGYFQDRDVLNLSHLLYYVKQDEGDISVRIASVVKQMGKLDYIPPVKVWTDLLDVPSREWEIFLERLAGQSVYHVILLDMGNSLNGLFGILNLCQRILVPFRKDVHGDAKMKQYHGILQAARYQELEARSLYLDMEKPVRQTVREALAQLEADERKECRNASGRAAP